MPTTVHRQTHTVDESAAFPRQKDNCRGNVLWAGKTGHWYPIDDVLIRISSRSPIGDIHLGFDPARTNRVDPHPAPAPLCSEGPRQAYQAMFGGIVGGAVNDATKSRDQGYIDNIAAIPGKHLPAERLRQQKRTLQIDCHNCLPLLEACRFGRCDAADPGVVDQHVRRAVARSNIGSQFCDKVRRRYIVTYSLGRETFCAQAVNQLIERLEIGQHDVIAGARQHLGRSQANTLSGSCDHGCLHQGTLPLRLCSEADAQAVEYQRAIVR